MRGLTSSGVCNSYIAQTGMYGHVNSYIPRNVIMAIKYTQTNGCETNNERIGALTATTVYMCTCTYMLIRYHPYHGKGRYVIEGVEPSQNQGQAGI